MKNFVFTAHSNKAVVLFLCFFSIHAYAETTWVAGSKHIGKVNIAIESYPATIPKYVSWFCDGKKCTLTGDYGNDLSLISCQNLVKRVGVLSFYGNNKGKMWSKYKPTSNTNKLSQCNSVADYNLDF